MSRQINDEGLHLVEQWEGLYLTAYHGAADRPGLLTIGYGHTDAAGPPKVTEGMTITNEQADTILRNDLSKCEAAVERLVKVTLNDNQFAALVSFAFNVGEGAFSGSTLLRKLNGGDYDSVPTELMKWCRSNGQRQQGLVNRRAAEAGLWAKGGYVASQYIEPEADKSSLAQLVLKPEILTTVAGSGGGIWAVLTNAKGPLEYALAFAIVIATGLTAYWIFLRIREHST